MLAKGHQIADWVLDRLHAGRGWTIHEPILVLDLEFCDSDDELTEAPRVPEISGKSVCQLKCAIARTPSSATEPV
jgi:hypothetical protein